MTKDVGYKREPRRKPDTTAPAPVRIGQSFYDWLVPKWFRCRNTKHIVQFTLIITLIGVMLLVFQTHQLSKALTQEKYLHQQSIESLSNVIQDYDDYTTQLENTIKEWRLRYDINEPLEGE